MADLGLVGYLYPGMLMRKLPLNRGCDALPLPTWSAIDDSHTISGQVTTNGVAVANARVILFYVNAPTVVAAVTFTDASGNYSFSGLDSSYTHGYFVIARDPSDTYNIGRLDRLSAG